MPTLLEVQTRFVHAMLNADDPSPANWALTDEMDLQTRLDVYRNNIFISLQDLLRERFSTVSKVVHERFFSYVTDSFIRENLPQEPVLSWYGEAFPKFLESFPACEHLKYLGDLARLEWLIFRARVQGPGQSLTSADFADFEPEELGRLRFMLDPSLGLLETRWPVDRIWRTNQSPDDAEFIDLTEAVVFLEIRCVHGQVGFRRLPVGAFVFRAKLGAGDSLEDAVEAAQASDLNFDISANTADLINEGLLASLRPSATHYEKGK